MENDFENTRGFRGTHGVYSHAPRPCSCRYDLLPFPPERGQAGAGTAMWFLSGLTATTKNAMT